MDSRALFRTCCSRAPGDSFSSESVSLVQVMVWIHGGGFMSGSASPYSPSRMVTDGDVIVVTIQYRLAAFGFLSTGDGAVPGNMGMRDQLLAVNWVKDNIRQFGGDPNDITIFGESAGSASVAALALTPGSKGLFTKAILQSGTLIAPWALVRNPQEKFYQFAERAGCRPWIYNPWNKLSYHQNMITCLRTKSGREIFDANPKYDVPNLPIDRGFGELTEFGLVTDYDFFPKAPLDLLKDKSYLQRQGVLNRTYMIGMTDNEGILGVMMYPQEKYGEITKPSNVASLIRSIVNGYLSWPAESGALNAVDFLYSFPRDADGNIPLQKVIDLYSDDLMTVPIMVFTRALVDASPSTPVYMYLFDSEPKVSNPRACPITPVYMYLFDLEPKVTNPRACSSTRVYMYLFDSEPKVGNPRACPSTPVYIYLFDSEPKVGNPRACPSTPVYLYLFDSEPKLKDPDGPISGTNHGMDLFHEFDGVGVDGLETLYFYANRDPAKYPIIASAFRGYVTQFAKTGNPVSSPSSSWPRYDRQNEQYLAISSQPEVRQHLYAQRVSLWTDFLPKMATSFFSGRNSGRPAFSG
ncbi:carboxylic ester hydrolase [Plakobranchus ocellatus]|uniref:Carboxylic ester hydrolase n=1 Tax=Plakobranchus ocellatus TaxID=259542 RepID=A0AAV4DE55_9GAST|nr:carboxylic ester hydrolase [Plakobranchus ocellatus]